MNPPGLFDGSFSHQRSATLGGERATERPAAFEWRRNERGRDVTFYTDMCLELARDDPGRKVAWLLEPPSLSDTHYAKALELESIFDCILTFRADLVARGEPWTYYPLGGSWIPPAAWGLPPKSRSVSIIVSEKVRAPGHKLRREILERFGSRLNAYGRGLQPIESKTEALRDFRYSIIVESWKGESYFSEKLIDCFSQGTLPIYWGDPAIGDIFDLGGMRVFDTLDDLGYILDEIGRRNIYAAAYPGIVDNFCTARAFTCAEDWLAAHFPFLFAGREP